MAARSKSRGSKRRTGLRKKARPERPDIPAWIEDAIETERSRLLKAYAVLGSLARAMLYSDDEDEPIAWSDVAAVAGDLISDAVDNLDSVSLKQKNDKAPEARGGTKQTGPPG